MRRKFTKYATVEASAQLNAKAARKICRAAYGEDALNVALNYTSDNLEGYEYYGDCFDVSYIGTTIELRDEILDVLKSAGLDARKNKDNQVIYPNSGLEVVINVVQDDDASTYSNDSTGYFIYVNNVESYEDDVVGSTSNKSDFIMSMRDVIDKTVVRYVSKLDYPISVSSNIEDNKLIITLPEFEDNISDLADYVYDSINDPMLFVEVIDDNTISICNAQDRTIESSDDIYDFEEFDEEAQFQEILDALMELDIDISNETEVSEALSNSLSYDEEDVKSIIIKMKDSGVLASSDIDDTKYGAGLASSDIDDTKYGAGLASGVFAGNNVLSDKIKSEVTDKINEVIVKPPFSVDQDLIDDYNFVEVKQSDDDRIIVEVRSELDYEDLVELSNELNPIVERYDKYAYFEAVEPGIIEAYLDVSPIQSSTDVYGYFDPYEYEEPDVLDDFEEYEEFDLDAYIVIDDKGDWEFEDDDTVLQSIGFKDNDDILPSGEYDTQLPLDYGWGVLEKIYDMTTSNLPIDPGRYRITGTYVLYYDVRDVQYSTELGKDKYGEYETYRNDSPETGDVTWNQDKSKITDFKYEKVSDSIKSATTIEGGLSSVKFDQPKMINGNMYDQYIIAEYQGFEFATYSNVVETTDVMQAFEDFIGQVREIHPYDDGDYYSARISKGTITYRNSKGVADRSYYMSADDWDMELSEWFEAVLAEAVENVRKLNKDVEPRMVHN